MEKPTLPIVPKSLPSDALFANLHESIVIIWFMLINIQLQL